MSDMPPRVAKFFEEAPEPEGTLTEIFDRAELEAAQRMDPSLGRVMRFLEETTTAAIEMDRANASLTRVLDAAAELDREALRCGNGEGRLGTSVIRRLIAGETLHQIDDTPTD